MSLTDKEKWAVMSAPYFGSRWSSDDMVLPTRRPDPVVASQYG